MIAVQYPEPRFRMKEAGGRRYIFDPIRRSWILLTEEEWVRQNFLAYLTAVLRYPPSFIALEKAIRLHELTKRFDILIYDAAHQPWMMVECKAPEVSLSEEVLQQVLRYHLSVPVPYLVITNGNTTLAWTKQDGGLKLVEVLPGWGGMNSEQGAGNAEGRK